MGTKHVKTRALVRGFLRALLIPNQTSNLQAEYPLFQRQSSGAFAKMPIVIYLNKLF